MSKKIKVIIKRPDSKPYSTNISNTLENLQKTVGGYIETYTGQMHTDVLSNRVKVVAICNEEGNLIGLPWCCHWYGSEFVGTVIWCGVDGDEFADIPIRFEDFKLQCPDMWREPDAAEV